MVVSNAFTSLQKLRAVKVHQLNCQPATKLLKTHATVSWLSKRLDSLKRFSAERKKALNDVDLQLEFIWKELNTTERNAFNKLIKSSNVKEATKLFSDHYERPAEYNGHHREKMSEEFYSLI